MNVKEIVKAGFEQLTNEEGKTKIQLTKKWNGKDMTGLFFGDKREDGTFVESTECVPVKTQHGGFLAEVAK